MKTAVKCKNCGIGWVRVVAYGDLELNIDLQYNCPKCGSNWYEPIDPVDMSCVKGQAHKGK